MKILPLIFLDNMVFSSLYQLKLYLPSFAWLWSYKNWDLSLTSISTSMLGHVPISSLRLNPSLYLYNISITSFFSSFVRHELSKSMYLSNISLSVMYFLLSLESNHGYLSPGSICSLSFFNVFMNLLKYLQSVSALSNL